ncbi:MAG TPA: hypothetical protein DCQ26_00400 [Marinilabiliales bacterium]|nr:MAG: hypothetical protein A2W95_08370 [Bacteroidetes bacterium GWA2_40_14]OFX75214.1 MAG: hypothetical protein A2W96_16580 [Bacteroidetes bacterium GWD2_40_43]OFX89811.1 MAG: hypothetical protein A2W97_12240 [Bacteroidetes bacterium GWE2_40_63]OFY21996.1 MAG: hypothetical protein A2W88_00605 [Bacteroidetes bacterium GWF2_40_13]OFZ26109.1 MAG: hypothetical protein A2437_10565 [Bacteroidetes bacterium RIFOXYC2_FULL_40_12]HAM97048.1 hypothetical protein [Marinilabiliales bacterium]
MTTEHYLNAAFIFQLNENKTMEFEILTDALLVYKERSIIWYELGLFYRRKYIAENKKKALHLSISCIKKALQIEPENEIISQELCKTTYYDNRNYKILQSVEPEFAENLIKNKINITDKQLVNAFNKLKSFYYKQAILVSLGQTKNIKYFGLLEFCSLNHENQILSQSAIKRLPYFTEQKDLSSIFHSIIENGKRYKNEPFFTMSLQRINKEWAKQMI